MLPSMREIGMASETGGVEAVERALRILDSLGPDGNATSLAELSRRTGFHKSTILRLAVSLTRFGYLVRDEEGLFRLGPTTWRIGSGYRHVGTLARTVRPELARLSGSTQETASLYVREGDTRVCLLRHEPDRAIRHAVAEGTILPLSRGAAGAVLLAFSDFPDEGDAGVRTAGHAISRGERDAEVAAVAVPLHSPSGRLIGALTLSGLVTRFGPENVPGLLAALQGSRDRLAGRVLS